MRSLATAAIIEGIRSRKDRSLGLSVSTPELTTQEKALFLEMQGINVELKITPLDEPSEEYIIDRDIEQKTQGQRIRSILYLLYKKDPEDMDFSEYYRNKTEKYIEGLKRKLDE